MQPYNEQLALARRWDKVVNSVSPLAAPCDLRGSNDAEYEIYKTNAEQLGWKVKSYEEWLSS
jgi:hypothetical protein